MGGIIGAAGLKRLFTYTDWANGAILDATAALQHEQLTRDLHSSFPSVRDTLVHIAESDWIWLRRWTVESPAGPPDWRVETHADVRQRWEDVMRERQAFLAPLDDAAMQRTVEYRRLDGSEHRSALWELLLHVVNHSTYHRGQVTTMLRQLGAPTVATDMTRWYREHAAELTP
ncbi:MAG TPA: DinB family protein [Longimicrobiales bacterium]|nr:DinB family protein [Longimicrobiales bacterium]